MTRVCAVIAMLAVAASSHAGDNPTVEQVSAAPDEYDRKVLTFDGVQVSGDFFSGPRTCRLAVRTKDGKLVSSKFKRDGITFVVPKRKGEAVTKGFEPGGYYPATLTCKIKQNPRGFWVAIVQKVDFKTAKQESPEGEGEGGRTVEDTPKRGKGLPRPRQEDSPEPRRSQESPEGGGQGERKVKDTPQRDNGPSHPRQEDSPEPRRPQERREVITTPAQAEALTLQQLVENYDPDEPESPVGQRLAKITKGQPCLICNNDQTINVKASMTLVKEIKDGFEPRMVYRIGGVPHRPYRVGERVNVLHDENPLYPKTLLRPDGVCDKTDRSWAEIPLKVRQVLYLGVTKTGEIKVERPEDAHGILDRLEGKTPEECEKWVQTRYPKSYLLYGEMQARGELPSLKQPPSTPSPKPPDKEPTSPPKPNDKAPVDKGRS